MSFEVEEKQESYYKSLLNSIGDGILVYDLDCNIVAANPALLAALGYTEEELIGSKCYEVLHSGAPCSGATCPIEQIREKPFQRGVTTHEHRTKEGSPVEVEITYSPFYDEEGRVEGMVEVCRDITEREKTGERLNTLKKRYELEAEDIVNISRKL